MSRVLGIHDVFDVRFRHRVRFTAPDPVSIAKAGTIVSAVGVPRIYSEIITKAGTYGRTAEFAPLFGKRPADAIQLIPSLTGGAPVGTVWEQLDALDGDGTARNSGAFGTAGPSDIEVAARRAADATVDALDDATQFGRNANQQALDILSGDAGQSALGLASANPLLTLAVVGGVAFLLVRAFAKSDTGKNITAAAAGGAAKGAGARAARVVGGR